MRYLQRMRVQCLAGVLYLFSAANGMAGEPARGTIAEPISPDTLAGILSRELGSNWLPEQPFVRLSPKIGTAYYICVAFDPRRQTDALSHFITRTRPMAIVWSANGWTLISDSGAWKSDREPLVKLTGVLERYWPDIKTWKTPENAFAQQRGR